MGATTGQCIEREGKDCRLRLPLTSPHFCDFAFVKGNSAHELDVVLTLTKSPDGCLTDSGEYLWEIIVQVFFVFVFVSKVHHHLTELILRHSLKFGFDAIDFIDDGIDPADFLFVGIA
jgi:hypothetical protein